MADPPDQSRLWNAYGHAMGASIGLELLFRIALINSAVAELSAESKTDQASRDKALADIMRLTFGVTVARFKEAYSDFANDAKFCESIDNAVASRNHLAHHFLEGILHGLRSEDGVRLATLHCQEAMQHFQSLEDYVRDNCPVDFAGFFAKQDGKAEEFVQNHPLYGQLTMIKEAEKAATSTAV